MEEKKIKRKDKKWWKRTKIALLFLLMMILLLSYSHFIAPHHFITKEVKIVSSKITNSFHGFKMVQISDLHYGNTITEKDLLKIQKEINLLKPDIVVFTGDLFEYNEKVTEEKQNIVTSFLNGIEALALAFITLIMPYTLFESSSAVHCLAGSLAFLYFAIYYVLKSIWQTQKIKRDFAKSDIREIIKK